MKAIIAQTGQTVDIRFDGYVDDDFLPPWGRLQLLNKTGAVSVKGQAININPALDNSYIAATEPFGVVGFFAEVGVPDGYPTWVTTRTGSRATFILEDGYAAMPGGWVRLSPTTAGRCIVQSKPGLDFPAASIAYDSDNGVTISGAITNTRLNDGTKLVIGGTTGGPSIDARIAFADVTETPTELLFNGYFGANRANGVTVSVWDYVAGGGSWVLIGTLEPSGTTDVSIVSTAGQITDDMVAEGAMLVRLYGQDAGVLPTGCTLTSACFT